MLYRRRFRAESDDYCFHRELNVAVIIDLLLPPLHNPPLDNVDRIVVYRTLPRRVSETFRPTRVECVIYRRRIRSKKQPLRRKIFRFTDRSSHHCFTIYKYTYRIRFYVYTRAPTYSTTIKHFHGSSGPSFSPVPKSHARCTVATHDCVYVWREYNACVYIRHDTRLDDINQSPIISNRAPPSHYRSTTRTTDKI